AHRIQIHDDLPATSFTGLDGNLRSLGRSARPSAPGYGSREAVAAAAPSSPAKSPASASFSPCWISGPMRIEMSSGKSICRRWGNLLRAPRADVFEDVDRFYNRRRRASTLNGKTLT